MFNLDRQHANEIARSTEQGLIRAEESFETLSSGRTFSGLMQALAAGCIVRGFRSGGGLRVIRIEDQSGSLRGYGEHPDVVDALKHADEDYLAGGREYSTVYGELYPHYLTGYSHASGPLDELLLQGGTFRMMKEKDSLVAEFKSYDLIANKEVVRRYTRPL